MTKNAEAQAIVDRIVAQPVPEVTAEDAAVLAAVPDRTLMMEKLLAVHCHMTGDFARALIHARAVFDGENSAENAKNIAMLHHKLQDPAAGLAFVEKHRAIMNPIEAADLCCMLSRSAGDIAAAVRHGDESLRLKDASTQPAPPITPQTHAFDPEQPDRNVIAFSLWGRDPRYLTGAINNAIVARYLYPGWRARFYIDESIGEKTITALLQNGAQVIMAPKELPAKQFGLFWRFLVEDDTNVAIWLCRDADSVVNIKERVAVEDWLASGRTFHIMRDMPSHAELILAGMWGAHRGNIGDMRQRIETHVANARKALNNRITDQVFLRQAIWPIVKQDVLMHDAAFGFGEPTRYRDEFRLPSNRHIGQNDWVHAAGRGGPRKPAASGS